MAFILSSVGFTTRLSATCSGALWNGSGGQLPSSEQFPVAA